MRPKRAISAALGAFALLAAAPNAVAADPSWGLREGYDQIYDRVERLGGEPGRHIVEDGVNTEDGARDAQRRDVIRAIRVLRRMEAGLRAPKTASAVARKGAVTGASAGAAASTAGAGLQAIARCESGGDPSAVSPDGRYRGKYQFDRQTWQSVGGSGDPAAAPEAEQDRRAAALMAQRGSSPWPVCG